MRTFLFLVALCALCASSQASHFRYGTITWQQTSATDVSFSVDLAWRASYFSGVKVGGTVAAGNFNDGSKTVAVSGCKITAVDPVADWFICTWEYSATYSGAGPYTAQFYGTARISTLNNNNDKDFVVPATVVLASSAPWVTSPVSKSLPIITVESEEDVLASFNIAAVGDDNEELTWSFETGQCGTQSCSQPKFLAVDPDTGYCTWNTTSLATGYWSATFMVTSVATGAAIPVDIILDLTRTPGTCSSECENPGVKCIYNNGCAGCDDGCVKPEPPSFVSPPTPDNDATLTAQTGTEFTVTIEARANSTSETVHIQEGALPSGATLSLDDGTNDVTRVFKWTPKSAQVGGNILCFSAVSSNGLTSQQRCFTILVSNVCDPACSGHSACIDSFCVCDPGWTGDGCDKVEGRLSPGKNANNALDMYEDAFYSFTNVDHPTATIVLTMRNNNTDAAKGALFVSTETTEPTITDNMWREIGDAGADVVMTIKPTDWDFIAGGTYYITVEAWYTGFNLLQYTLELAFQE